MKNFEVSPEKDHKSMDTFLEDWDYYATLRQYALENKTIDGYKNGRILSHIELSLKNLLQFR